MLFILQSGHRAGQAARFRLSAPVALAAISLLLAAPAIAQDEPTANDTAPMQLAPINVEGQSAVPSATAPIDGYVAERTRSATKTDTPLLETPQAVSVISAEQIRDQSARSVREVLRYVSGVVPEARGNVASRYTQVTLRGFTPDIYLDGLKLQGYYYALPQVDPFLLERVEVLKGPASVLYGQAPPGGIVNLVSKRPTEDQVNTFFTKVGNDDRAGLGFDVGGSLNEDSDVLYRLVAVGDRRNGPQKTVESSHFSIAPSLKFNISDTTDLTLLGKYRRDPKGGAYGQLPATGTLDPIPGFGKLSRDFYDGDTGFEQFDREQTRLGYEFSHWFNDSLQFRQNVRWSEIEIDYKSVFAVGLNDSQTALERNIAASTGTTNGLSIDNQFLSYFDTGSVSHTLLAGFVYQDLDGERRTGRPLASESNTPDLDIRDPDYSQDITPPSRTRFTFDQDQTGLYLQDQARTGNLTLIGGGRYDSIETRQVMFPNDAASTPASQSRSDHAFSARAGALYNFDYGIAPYVSYSESFQAPGVSRADILDPTEGTQYEAGVKYQPPGSNILLSSSLFQLTQANVPTTNPVTLATTQTGEVEIRGAEVEAKAGLREGLDLSLAATWLDSEITSAQDGTRGNEFARTPAFTASMWLDYTLQGGAWRGLGAGLGVRHIGEQFARNNNQLEVDAYTLVDAALHYELGGLNPAWQGWGVALNVENALDEKYVASCYAVTGCFFGYGRQTTATVSYRWR